MSHSRAPRREHDGGRSLLDAPVNNPNARIIPGFRIHKDTLDSLGPLERIWARKLIDEGTWRLILDDEATL